MMRLRAFVAALWLLCCIEAAAQTWPNEPAGSAVVLDCSFSQQLTNPSTACNILNVYSAGTIVSDSDPVSPPGAYRSRIEAGQKEGGTQLNWFHSQVVSEMYMGMLVRTNPQFEGRTTANKMFFLRGPGQNGFWGLDGNPGDPSGSIYFGHNSGTLDNSHTCSYQLGLKCFPNVNGVQLVKGVWTKVEAYVKKSTTATSRDGIVRWWVNGVLSGNYTNINYAQNGLNEWVWSETWDGTVNNPVPSVPWEWYLGHLHVSIPNCQSDCQVNPPPPPPLPPNKPSNLRVQ